MTLLFPSNIYISIAKINFAILLPDTQIFLLTFSFNRYQTISILLPGAYLTPYCLFLPASITNIFFILRPSKPLSKFVCFEKSPLEARNDLVRIANNKL